MRYIERLTCCLVFIAGQLLGAWLMNAHWVQWAVDHGYAEYHVKDGHVIYIRTSPVPPRVNPALTPDFDDLLKDIL